MDRFRSLLRFASLPDMPESDGTDNEMLESPSKRVGFISPTRSTTFEVTPYARKYGVHPNFFYFTRKGERQLTDSGIVENMRRKDEGLAPLKLDGDPSP